MVLKYVNSLNFQLFMISYLKVPLILSKLLFMYYWKVTIDTVYVFTRILLTILNDPKWYFNICHQIRLFNMVKNMSEDDQNSYMTHLKGLNQVRNFKNNIWLVFIFFIHRITHISWFLTCIKTAWILFGCKLLVIV